MFDFESSGVTSNDMGNSHLRESFPSDGKKVLYLDADYIPYTVGFCSKEWQWESYNRGEYDISQKYNHVCYLINDAMSKARADSVILFFTRSGGNFRATLTDSYKAQRATEKPFFWEEMREYMITQFPDNIVEAITNEADDMISIHATNYYKELDSEDVPREMKMYDLWSKIIIGSKDKDLDQVYGWHVDLTSSVHYFVDFLGELDPICKFKEVTKYEMHRMVNGITVDDDFTGCVDTYSRGNNKGKPKLKRVAVGTEKVAQIKKLKGTGYKFFCAQVLMGDPVDNYFGLPSYGATTAFNLLDGCSSEEECMDVIVREYTKVYPDTWKDELTLQCRFAWLQQYEGELWSL